MSNLWAGKRSDCKNNSNSRWNGPILRRIGGATLQRKTFSILCRTPCGDRRHIVKPMRVQHPDRTQIFKRPSQNSKIGIYKIFMQGPCARSSRSSYTTSPGSPQDLLLRTYARLRKWMPEQQDLLKILRSTKYCACHKTWIRCKPGPTFCASLRSRNAHGHLRRARLCDTMKMLQTKIGAHTLREPAQFKCTWTSQKGNFMWEFTMKMWQTKSLRTPRRRLCASLRIRNAHRHLTRTLLGKMPGPKWSTLI